jgi:prepilin-type N-terminal cleavage/methylation domain-containing protein
MHITTTAERKQASNTRAKAFTLIELLVVTTIIARERVRP